ncbi:hypothetical protein ABIE45_004266 [Methylobacterium sp. OAE515]
MTDQGLVCLPVPPARSGPDTVRPCRRDRSHASAPLVHNRGVLEAGATPDRLKGVIHDISVRSPGDQLDKLNRYSDQQADDLEARGGVIPSGRTTCPSRQLAR